MRRIPVESSVIANVGYSPGEQILEVEFHSGRVYQYLNVPPEQYGLLMSADSIGSYYNRNIRDKYESQELPRKKRPMG
jgi:hypothetical protein